MRHNAEATWRNKPAPAKRGIVEWKMIDVVMEMTTGTLLMERRVIPEAAFNALFKENKLLPLLNVGHPSDHLAVEHTGFVIANRLLDYQSKLLSKVRMKSSGAWWRTFPLGINNLQGVAGELAKPGMHLTHNGKKLFLAFDAIYASLYPFFRLSGEFSGVSLGFKDEPVSKADYEGNRQKFINLQVNNTYNDKFSTTPGVIWDLDQTKNNTEGSIKETIQTWYRQQAIVGGQFPEKMHTVQEAIEHIRNAQFYCGNRAGDAITEVEWDAETSKSIDTQFLYGRDLEAKKEEVIALLRQACGGDTTNTYFLSWRGMYTNGENSDDGQFKISWASKEDAVKTLKLSVLLTVVLSR